MSSTLRALLLSMLVGRGSARQCFNLTIPVTISALNYVFDLSPASTNIDATNFILDWTRQGSNYLAQITAGQRNVSGTYSLGATYCVPDSTGISPPSTILLLTHGISFDRSYWDLPLAAYNYSFVLPATSAPYNFATLAWDRLGIAQSLPPNADAVNEIQSYLEIAALEALAKGLKTGSLATAPLNGHKFDKVVGIGHSFGSGQTYSVAQQNPDYSAFDAIVLTGFSQNATFVPYFALGGNFVAEGSGVSGYPTGYLAAGDPGGVQTNFLSPGMFDAAALQYAFSPAGKPVSVGELLTIGGYTGMTSNFPGPTLIITGDRDIPFCGGSCRGTGDVQLASIPAASRSFLPRAKPFKTVIVPKAGHGLNLEFSHVFTYDTVLTFVADNVQ